MVLPFWRLKKYIMIWKTIEGYDSYEISNTGTVKSLGLIVKRGKGKFKMNPRILSPGKDKNGYLQVCLYNNGLKKMCKVHRLVILNFSKKIDERDCVNHKNGNKKDNRIENLEWCTKGENHEHAVKMKLKIENGDKPTGQYDLDGNLIAIYKSCIEASRQLKLSSGNISLASRGIWSKYKGFKWKYQ